MKTILFAFLFLSLQFSCSTQTGNAIEKQPTGFVSGSAAFSNNGNYPKLYTCDSAGISPTLQWSGAPKGTVSYAVTMHHIAKDGEKHVYMVLYDLPASVKGIPDAVQGIGKWGTNTANRRNSYTPPCSKGPGAKTYIITVYALSAVPEISLPNSPVTMDVLLKAIKDKTLASSAINVIYSR